GEHSFLRWFAMSTDRLYPQSGNATRCQYRQQFLFKGEEICVERVEWHLHRVKRESRVQHSQMYIRILMTAEAGKAYLSLLLRFFQGFRRSVWPDKLLWVIRERDSVNLP